MTSCDREEEQAKWCEKHGENLSQYCYLHCEHFSTISGCGLWDEYMCGHIIGIKCSCGFKVNEYIEKYAWTTIRGTYDCYKFGLALMKQFAMERTEKPNNSFFWHKFRWNRMIKKHSGHLLSTYSRTSIGRKDKPNTEETGSSYCISRYDLEYKPSTIMSDVACKLMIEDVD